MLAGESSKGGFSIFHINGLQKHRTDQQNKGGLGLLGGACSRLEVTMIEERDGVREGTP